MVKFTKNSFIDHDKYCDRLNRTGFIYYDSNRAKVIVSYLQNRSITLAARALMTMRMRSGGGYSLLTKEAVYEYLTKYENCPDKYFYTGKTKGISLDKKRVLEKLYSNGKAVQFLEDYMEHRSMMTKCSDLRTLVNQCKREDAVDHNGQVLSRIPFVASLQQNQRYNYRQYDIISQIPKEACDTIAADEGYFLAWGDFAQSDFRIAYNLFLRSEENDRIMAQYEDKYEALARIVHKTLGMDFDLEKFKSERNVYKTMTLATMYGTRSSQVGSESEFIQTFTQFLDSCPKYKEYCDRLWDNVSLKPPSLEITSYFGSVEYVPYRPDHQSVVNGTLNKPIQSGTSEVVILTVNSILDMAKEAGLDDDQFSVYLVRHDEPVFRIRKDALPFVWILQQHQQILVDDWTPLRMDFEYGYNYRVRDAALTDAVEECLHQNRGKITSLEYSIGKTNDYYPIKEVLKIGVHWIIVDSKTVLTFFNLKDSSATFMLLDTVNQDDIIMCVRKRLSDVSEAISERYCRVAVLNNFYAGDDYFGNSYFVYRYVVGPEMNSTIWACKDMVYRYCMKYGVPIPDGVVYSGNKIPARFELLEVGGDA